MSEGQEAWTCGMGLAASAELPEGMAGLLSVMARNLETRDGSGYLEALAGEMTGYRELPMAPHDDAALNTPEVAAAFQEPIATERNLADYLTASANGFEGAAELQ